jgi:bifunctional non-homologous end joining protein LigD
MSLSVYTKKRNFEKTPEPGGRGIKSKANLSFVVQRHKASHLHYDFRLEMDGVLKSWAVPKGPSLNPGDKRLAMMVEDHPYNYKNFSGIIPEGNYGAGIVEIWDEGRYADLDNSEKIEAEKKLKAGLHAGSIKFRLYGKKLKGEFALVKLKGKQENAWLLIKHKDEYAVEEPYSSEEQTKVNSPINKWLKENRKESGSKKKTNGQAEKSIDKKASLKKKARKYPLIKTKKVSNYIKPMLAKEIDKPFSDKEWVYEIKWDGYRAVAELNGRDVKLYSRNGNSFDAAYPIVIDALRKLNITAVLDGEVVVLDENGKSNFQLLQYYGSETQYPIVYVVFDLLSVNGQNTCDLPLTDRKKLLKQLLGKNTVVKYSEHIKEKGVAFFEASLEKDLEGIMAKKADSLYHSGVRSSEWLKIKNHKSQEAIIAGFTEPTGGRKHFGALVLGMMDGNVLKYIGHTGSGFDNETLNKMSKLLKPLIQKKSPFAEEVKTNMPVTWVKPQLVCEIKYTEWTRDGRMRHPIFLRLRNDKKAKEVMINNAKPLKGPKKTSVEKKKIAEDNESNEKIISFGKIKVTTTNRNKIFWPDEKITKGEVINYYQSISEYILPFLKDRPQSLKRNPNGIYDKGFFHKDAGQEAPAWVKSKPLFSESAKKNINYILCNNAATLAYLNNLGCIEINPWHSTIQKLDYPDYLIVDIDPSEKNTFEQVIETANVIGEIFKKAGVESYCKTSGAKGIHVYVPTQKKYTYEQLKDFAHLICMLTQEQLPKFTSLERNLKKRGNKMIYLDHLQNRRGQTISSVFSLRPVEGATVSMPLQWKEVKPGLSPLQFTIHNSLERIKKYSDFFSGVLGRGIDLGKCLKQLG